MLYEVITVKAVKKVIDWHDLLFFEESYLRWMVYFFMLIRQFDPEETLEICEKFEMPARYQTIFCRERYQADQALFRLTGDMPVENSTLV